MFQQEKYNFKRKFSFENIEGGCGCAIIILAIAMAFSLPEVIHLLQTIVEKW